MGPTLASLLPSSIQIAANQQQSNNNSNTHNNNNSNNNIQDEVHLIMEYEKGAVWGGYQSPRANRFIIHSDQANGKFLLMDSFHQSVMRFQPALLVLSGLHLLDGQPAEERAVHIQRIISFLTTEYYPSNNKNKDNRRRVHLELASIGDIGFVKQLIDTIVPRVDSLGLNEQELRSVVLAMNRNSNSKSNSNSDTNSIFHKELKAIPVANAIKDLFKYIDSSSNNNNQLTRVHFHCLTFHLIVQRKNSIWTKIDNNSNNNKSNSNRNSAVEAVAYGSYTASTQACDTQQLDPSQVELLFDLKLDDKRTIDPNYPVLTWTEGDGEQLELEFFLAPVLVCKVPLKTVGLGDSISAVGLIRQLNQ